MAATISGAGDLRARVVRALAKCGRTFDRTLIRERLSGPTSSNSLSRRTGQLARSGTHAVSTHPTRPALQVAIGGGVPYARAHEHGATIAPKKAKMLAIPIGAARTAAGVSRVTSPRNWPKPLKLIVHRGKALLVEMLGSNKKLKPGDISFDSTAYLPTRKKEGVERVKIRTAFRPVFVLKSQVTLPARLGFGKTFAKVARACLADLRAELGTIRLRRRR